jgi:hypothetical protein
MTTKLAERIKTPQRLMDPSNLPGQKLRDRLRARVENSAGVIKDAAVKPASWWSRTKD